MPFIGPSVGWGSHNAAHHGCTAEDKLQNTDVQNSGHISLERGTVEYALNVILGCNSFGAVVLSVESVPVQKSANT